MEKTKFSVIICTLNRPIDLKACLESISRQSYQPFETIIVDASDDDKSNRIVEQWEIENELKVHHFRSKPGLTRQRNFGMHHATGDVIAFLDDDVILDRDYFKEMAIYFENNEDVAGATGYITNLGKERKYAKVLRKLFLLTGSAPTGVMKRSGFPDFVDPALAEKMTPTQVLSGCNMLYRKKILSQFKFDEFFHGYSLGEDAEFSYRVSKCHPLLFIKEARLIHQRSNAERIDRKKYFEMSIVNRHHIFKKNVMEKQSDYFYFYWSTLGISLRSTYWVLRERNFMPMKGIIYGYLKIINKNQ